MQLKNNATLDMTLPTSNYLIETLRLIREKELAIIKHGIKKGKGKYKLEPGTFINEAMLIASSKLYL